MNSKSQNLLLLLTLILISCGDTANTLTKKERTFTERTNSKSPEDKTDAKLAKEEAAKIEKEQNIAASKIQALWKEHKARKEEEASEKIKDALKAVNKEINKIKKEGRTLIDNLKLAPSSTAVNKVRKEIADKDKELKIAEKIKEFLQKPKEDQNSILEKIEQNIKEKEVQITNNNKVIAEEQSGSPRKSNKKLIKDKKTAIQNIQKEIDELKRRLNLFKNQPIDNR